MFIDVQRVYPDAVHADVRDDVNLYNLHLQRVYPDAVHSDVHCDHDDVHWFLFVKIPSGVINIIRQNSLL